MDNEVRALRLENNLPAKEMVSVVRELYPKFDKPLLSKCEHGDLYGVDLRPDALAALKQYAGDDRPSEAKKRRKADWHRKPGRCYVRLWLQGMYIYDGIGRLLSNAFSDKESEMLSYPEKPYPLFEGKKTPEELESQEEAEERRARAYMLQMDMAFGRRG